MSLGCNEGLVELWS